MKDLILSRYSSGEITWEQAYDLLRKGGHTIEADYIYHSNHE